MRIVTWNVNGIRSLIKEYGSIDAVFSRLNADIVCFQESRIGTNDITADLIPDGYDAFASSSSKNAGYAGVMTFTRSPIKPAHSYSSLLEIINLLSLTDEDEELDSFVEEADSEGRVILSSFDNGFVLNVTVLEMTISENNEERIAFRTRFYSVMKRVIQRLQASQKHLIVVGDFNTICGLYDSAYMKYDVESNGFVETFRSMSDWLESLLLPESEEGCGMVDVFRYKHPDATDAYTCFNTKLGGRTNNFGTRIDYILCDPGMKDHLTECIIRSELSGSDHLAVSAVDVDVVFSSEKPCSGLRQRVGRQQKIHSFFKRKGTNCTVVKRKREEEKVELEDGVWACGQCTFHNSTEKEYCEMCGAKRRKREKEGTERIDCLFGGKRSHVEKVVPLCSGHHLPCVRHQVQKEGKNKGRFFFCCRLPIGLKSDPNARCNFFQWDE